MLPVDVRDGRVRFGDRALDLDASGATPGASRLFVRRHDMQVEPGGAAALQGTVQHVRTFGPIQRAEIALKGQGATVLEVDAPRDKGLSVGDLVGLKPRRYRIFPASE